MEGRAAPASHGAHSGTVQGTCGSPEPGARLSGSAQEDHGSGLEGRGGVAVPTLEPHIEGTGDGHGQGPDARRPNVGSSSNDPSVPQASHCESLPMQKKADRDDDDSGHIRHECIAAQSQLHSSVGHSEDSAEQRGVSALGTSYKTEGLGRQRIRDLMYGQQ